MFVNMAWQNLKIVPYLYGIERQIVDGRSVYGSYAYTTEERASAHAV